MHGITWERKVVLKMARKKQEVLVLFPEALTITRKFSDVQFGSLMRAVLAYRFNGDTYTGDDIAIDVAFQAITGQIDRYLEYCQKQSSNAKGSESMPSAAKGSQTEPQESKGTPSTPPNPYPNPYPSPMEESEAAKPPTRPRFSPPSVQDVADYCQEKGYAVDAARFVDYYSSIGWKVGKNPMRDWKAAVRTWARKDSPQPATPEPLNCGYVLAPPEDPWEAAMRKQREAGHV